MVWLELFNLLHFIGLAWGVGGATAAAIISAKSEKNPEIAHAAMKIIPSISKLIWFGIILLIISGIGLSYSVKWPINTKLLLIKHILYALIIIIGIAIGIIIKRLHILAPKQKETPSIQFLRAKKKLKFLSLINLILWYTITVLSVFI